MPTALLLPLVVLLLEHLIVIHVAAGLLLHEAVWLLLHVLAKLLLWYSTAKLLLPLLLLETFVLQVVVVLAAVASHVPLCLTLLKKNVRTHLRGRTRQNILVALFTVDVHCILLCGVALMAHELLGAVPAGVGR